MPRTMATSAWQPVGPLSGTYESLEERRRKAAEALSHLKSQFISCQTSTDATEVALREQESCVAKFKELYAAHTYLATSFRREAPNAVTYCQGAKLLSQAYPDTPYFQREAELLVQGMDRCVGHQVELAESCTHDIAVIADHLARAQRRLRALVLEVEQANVNLQDLKSQLDDACKCHTLLLMPKQWSRYKW